MTLFSFGVNIRAGEWVMLPEDWWPECITATALVLRLHAAPADALSMNGTLLVAENG